MSEDLKADEISVVGETVAVEAPTFSDTEVVDVTDAAGAPDSGDETTEVDVIAGDAAEAVAEASSEDVPSDEAPEDEEAPGEARDSIDLAVQDEADEADSDVGDSVAIDTDVEDAVETAEELAAADEAAVETVDAAGDTTQDEVGETDSDAEGGILESSDEIAAGESTEIAADESAEVVAEEEPDFDGLNVELRPALEALLMVSDQPMTIVDLATFLEVPADEVEEALISLAAEYQQQGRGFELRCIDSGWRFYSAAQCADVVAKFATDGRTARLTQASLETLAVVAYKQPISRARIGAIRGVNVDGVMRTLITRGLVTEVETDPATGAVLYGTTGFFLERMGVGSLDELPPIEDHLPDLSVLDEFIDPTTS